MASLMDGVGTRLGTEAFFSGKTCLGHEMAAEKRLEPGNIPFAPEEPLDTALSYHTSLIGSCPNTATIESEGK